MGIDQECKQLQLSYVRHLKHITLIPTVRIWENTKSCTWKLYDIFMWVLCICRSKPFLVGLWMVAQVCCIMQIIIQFDESLDTFVTR